MPLRESIGLLKRDSDTGVFMWVLTKFVRTAFFKDRLCCLLASAREIFFSVCYIILYFKQKALNVGEKILL